jgi:hypothetical protein
MTRARNPKCLQKRIESSFNLTVRILRILNVNLTVFYFIFRGMSTTFKDQLNQFQIHQFTQLVLKEIRNRL